MDQTIDISQRVNEYAVAAARNYVASQLARPGATGHSPDGAVAVTVNGLGDITDVRVKADGVAPEVAARLAVAVKTAWAAAARSLAVAEANDNPLARQPGLAEFLDEQIEERYGPQAPEKPVSHHHGRPDLRRSRVEDDVDFSEQGFMRRADGRS
jgi:DNA-binding protein YbaB